MKFLVELCHCDPLLSDDRSTTIVHYAAASGNLAALKYFTLSCQCDPQVKTTPSQTTPLHYAAHNGKLEVVKFLIEDMKCDPCCVHIGGETPLHEACKCAHTNIVWYLVDNNYYGYSSLLLRNKYGVSALDFLTIGKQFDLAFELLSITAYYLEPVLRPDIIWKTEECFSSLYTWGLKSVGGHKLFNSSLSAMTAVVFIVQYLRILTRTSDIAGPECTDWNNGGLIVYQNGTRAVIEVSENMSELHLVMQCVKGKEMYLVEKRSFLIYAIRKKLRTGVETSEFMLPPQNQYPPETTSEIPCPEIARSLVRNIPCVSCFHHDGTRQEISMSELLHFDSFQLVKEQFYKEIIKNQASDESVPNQLLEKVCSAVISNDQLYNCLKQQASSLQLTYRQLNAELRKYTIFSEANLLVSAYYFGNMLWLQCIICAQCRKIQTFRPVNLMIHVYHQRYVANSL